MRVIPAMALCLLSFSLLRAEIVLPPLPEGPLEEAGVGDAAGGLPPPLPDAAEMSVAEPTPTSTPVAQPAAYPGKYWAKAADATWFIELAHVDDVLFGRVWANADVLPAGRGSTLQSVLWGQGFDESGVRFVAQDGVGERTLRLNLQGGKLFAEAEEAIPGMPMQGAWSRFALVSDYTLVSAKKDEAGLVLMAQEAERNRLEGMFPSKSDPDLSEMAQRIEKLLLRAGSTGLIGSDAEDRAAAWCKKKKVSIPRFPTRVLLRRRDGRVDIVFNRFGYSSSLPGKSMWDEAVEMAFRRRFKHYERTDYEQFDFEILSAEGKRKMRWAVDNQTMYTRELRESIKQMIATDTNSATEYTRIVFADSLGDDCGTEESKYLFGFKSRSRVRCSGIQPQFYGDQFLGGVLLVDYKVILTDEQYDAFGNPTSEASASVEPLGSYRLSRSSIARVNWDKIEEVDGDALDSLVEVSGAVQD